MESKKLYGASTQMTPAVYKDFYKTYYNEKLKVFKIVAEIVGLIAIFGAFYILANGYGILWEQLHFGLVHFCFLSAYDIPQAIQKRKRQQSDNALCFFENYMSEKQNHT